MYPTGPGGGGFYPPDETIAAQTARNREAILILSDYANCPYRAIGKDAQYCGLLSGPGVAPELTRPVAYSDGKVTLTWTDESTNENGFAVFRVTPAGTLLGEVTDYRNVNTAGVGGSLTVVDGTPVSDPSQRCYQVVSYDDAGVGLRTARGCFDCMT
jgi:hypothetical protein